MLIHCSILKLVCMEGHYQQHALQTVFIAFRITYCRCEQSLTADHLQFRCLVEGIGSPLACIHAMLYKANSLGGALLATTQTNHYIPTLFCSYIGLTKLCPHTFIMPAYLG